MKEIILASASPRRSELLRQIGLEFRIIPPDGDEDMSGNRRPGELVEDLACKKALNVAGELNMSCLVIGADTVVVKDGVLGKPRTRQHAFEMLATLSNSWHEVVTGITIVECPSMNYIKGHETTRVKMRKLTDQMIEEYVNSGEPMDKAGSYGIQGRGAVLVEKIEGCYFNVVGLPLARLSIMLETFGVYVLGGK